MTHYIARFGNATFASATVLPIAAPDQDIGSEDYVPTARPLPGGYWFNSLGTARSRPMARQLSLRGSYKAASAAALQTLHDALMALVGKYDVLWMDCGITQRWRYARLLQVRAPARPNIPLAQEYNMTFELYGRYWSGASQSSSHAKGTFTLPNAGDVPVTDAVLIWTPSGSSSTTFSVTVTGVSEISYTGTVASGQALQIDCGQKSVLAAGVNGYTIVFSLTANHTIDDWLRIEPGGTSIVVASNAAGGSFAYNYSDAWS